MGEDLIERIRHLYGKSTSYQALFDWTAGRERDATLTSINRICSQLNIPYGAGVALARQLEEAGCGEFIVGRRGQKSRFKWRYSCISLGKAAAGEYSDLEEVENPVPEDEEDLGDQQSSASPQSVFSLAIDHAKATLAASLGVPISGIEITVRA